LLYQDRVNSPRAQEQVSPPTSPSVPVADENRWPKQIKFIVGNEACERFSYYGMLGILAGYISGRLGDHGLGQTKDVATIIIANFKFVNYFMPLIGAWLSDKIIGRYHTILWVSLFYCAGHGVLAASDLAHTPDGRLLFLYTGLALIACGSGGIKPCVSAFMGDQFKANQSHLLQKAYGAFYWSINFGSFFAFLVIPKIKDAKGYSWAFAVPGILMGMATFIFWLGTKHYVRVPPSRQTKSAGFIPVFLEAFRGNQGPSLLPTLNILAAIVLPLLAMLALAIVALIGNMSQPIYILCWAGLVTVAVWYLLAVGVALAGGSDLPDSFWQGARKRFSEDEIAAARTVSPILFVFALIPIFWSLFDQSNSTWVLQGNDMVPFNIFGIHVGAEEMQSANALLVMILVPILTLGVYPLIGKWARPLKRMSFGLFLTAASYVIVALIQKQIENHHSISLAWQVVPYIVLTTAEVLVSTTGLEFAFTQAAPQMKSSVMSFWLLTVSFGNLIVTAVTKLLASGGKAGESGSVSTSRFFLYAGMTFIVAILFSLVAASYRYRKGTVD
jgi:POT family proton-dependent oligopeptide transporter